jgi:methylated-DNA-protein-cysteine methyltransferase related protein
MILKENIQISDFYREIYQIVSLIPFGRVTTYGAIAKSLGRPGASRQIGYALNYSNKYDFKLPAHRVVNRIGALTGKAHFKPPSLMQTKLENEGILIVNNCIKNFETHFWNPLDEII